MCKIAVGVVGGNTGGRHVSNVNVSGWHGKRRSVQRQVRVLPPPANVVIWGAAVREDGADKMQIVVGLQLSVVSFWVLVIGGVVGETGYWFLEKDE